jgi:hypothetical protein
MIQVVEFLPSTEFKPCRAGKKEREEEGGIGRGKGGGGKRR